MGVKARNQDEIHVMEPALEAFLFALDNAHTGGRALFIHTW
jgi:hypothetical protein